VLPGCLKGVVGYSVGRSEPGPGRNAAGIAPYDMSHAIPA
jgi:hypothetical protein